MLLESRRALRAATHPAASPGVTWVESLETRMLFAFAVNVNFQPAGAVTPPAYVADSGEKYGSRANGFTYGWDASNTTTTRDRDPKRVGPDEAEDTFVHLQKPSSRDAVWEIAVPNGWYEVKAVSGDAWYFNSVFRLDVEGMLAVNGTPSTNTRWLDGTVKVNVTDGKLTVRSAAGAQNNKLCSLQIAEVSTAPAVAKIVGYNPGPRDDAMFIQAAINNLPAGGTLVLEPRTYVLDRGLVINKPIRIEGQNATLSLNTRSWPENQTLRIDSKLATTSYKWTGAISAGATTLNVRVPTAELKAGDMIWVGLGQDPNDPYEEHFATVCRVVQNTGSAVTIDTPVPRNIIQGAKQHVIRKVTSMAENVTVRNLRFDHTATAVPDININVSAARNVAVENIAGRFTILTNVADSDAVTFKNIEATLVKPHLAAGRLITAWQSGGITFNNTLVNTAGENPVVFLESWNRQSTFNDLNVKWNSTATTPKAAIFHVAGGSVRSRADRLTVTNTAPITLVSTGGQAGEYTFGQVTISGPVQTIPLYAIEDLTQAGTHYTSASVTKEIALQSGWKDYSLPLVKGIVKRVTVSITDAAGVKGLYVLNDRLQGGAVTSGFTAGKPFTWTYDGLLGTTQVANDSRYPNWSLRLYTAAVAAGARLTVTVEYSPIS